MHEETGKPLDDALLEFFLAMLHIDWAARHANRVLAAPGAPRAAPIHAGLHLE